MKTHPNDSIHNSEQGVQDGLTKREHFASIALQGLLAATANLGYHDESLCEASVRIADILIDQLNKEETK